MRSRFPFPARRGAMAARRVVAAAAAVLVACACAGLALAAASSQTASLDGVTATLSYSGGVGAPFSNLHLTIAQGARQWYSAPITSKDCLKAPTDCAPMSARAVHVVRLAGNGAIEVVVDLFSGGADCCSIEQVFTPVGLARGHLRRHAAHFRRGRRGPQDLSHNGQYVLVSGDQAFYCEFATCATSGLPILILGFNGGLLHRLTSHYRSAIAADAQSGTDSTCMIRRRVSASCPPGRRTNCGWASRRRRPVPAPQQQAGHISRGYVKRLDCVSRQARLRRLSLIPPCASSSSTTTTASPTTSCSTSGSSVPTWRSCATTTPASMSC